MSQTKISARIRERSGKGAARSLRRNNEIPGIFYGPKVAAPVMVAVKSSDFQGIVKETNIENVILGLEIGSDKGKDFRNVMIKELQTDPVKDTYFHIDFYEISMDKEISINVPIHLVNTPIGVTSGGILQHVRRELTISALPDKLIEFIEADVSGLDMGEALHIEDIQLPEGVRTTLDGKLAVAVVAAPAVTAEVAVEGEEEAEEGVEAEAKGAEEEGASEE